MESTRSAMRGSNVVVLEADVAKVFPNADVVNSSLRSLAKIIRHWKSLTENRNSWPTPCPQCLATAMQAWQPPLQILAADPACAKASA